MSDRIDNIERQNWLWAFATGAAFAAGRLDRGAFLASLPLSDAPPVAQKLLRALETGDSEGVKSAFAGFHVFITSGADLFPKLTESLQLSSVQATMESHLEACLFKLRAGHPDAAGVIASMADVIDGWRESVGKELANASSDG